MWECPTCGEKHEDALEACSNCGGESPSHTNRKLRKLLAGSGTVLSLKRYLALVRGLPLPSIKQRREFVDYVTDAHSWYKHLPRFLPGAPFYFFIDRYAGCDCIRRRDGSCFMAERKEQGFHYSAIPTAEYRSRFGFLNYACAHGTAVFLVNEQPMAVPRDKIIAVPGEDGQLHGLPQWIRHGGRVELTAFIAPTSAVYHFWDEGVGPEHHIPWPRASGGQATLQKIFKRCAEMRQPDYRKEREARSAKCIELLKSCRTPVEAQKIEQRYGLDPILSALLEPEQARQKTEMLKAIDRVCSFIQEAGPSRAT
jgi:hypothetical protein